MEKFNVRVTPTSVYLNGEKLKRMYLRSSRQIYMNDKYVVKVELKEDRGSFRQCRSENTLWKRVSRKDRKYFVPILAYKHTKEYDYVIQPRVKIRFYNNEEKLARLWDEFYLDEITRKYDLSDLFPDLPCNWGIVDKQVIIVDYGL